MDLREMGYDDREYGKETWTLRQNEEKRIEAFDKWMWRRLERVNWTDRIRNEVVLKKVGEERMMLKLIGKRKRNCFDEIGDSEMVLREMGLRIRRGLPDIGIIVGENLSKTHPGVQEVDGAPTDPMPTSASQSPSIIEKVLNLVKGIAKLPLDILDTVFNMVAKGLNGISGAIESFGKGGSTAASTPAPKSS
ncbi:hypothetical protein ANN_26795 [Periplaneta americana]|uniref:Per a allergen n=1 Tax=Periplaneta americana TaxID=6978 RepID=A0ABQ8RZR0_PERAM|nr:hypothetical protein ANN_26795 [Periplaneta americana]